MERFPEIIQGYYANDIWNMEKLEIFFKALLDTGLVNKTKKYKDGKKSKNRIIVTFFVFSSGFNVCKPVVIKKNKVPRCF